MSAENLAWHLKDINDEAFHSMCPDTLRKFDVILQGEVPHESGDLAYMAVKRCRRLVTEALERYR